MDQPLLHEACLLWYTRINSDLFIAAVLLAREQCQIITSAELAMHVSPIQSIHLSIRSWIVSTGCVGRGLVILAGSDGIHFSSSFAFQMKKTKP